jgi:hypothetical protein
MLVEIKLNMFGNEINPEKIKNKNTRLLKKWGIDVIEHLPWIEINELRSHKEVAERCVILSALFQLHLGAPKDFIQNYLIKNKLINSLSPNEHKLLATNFDELKKQDQINLHWSIEAIWALTWVGKKHKNLSFNTSVEDSLAEMLPNFEQSQSPEKFINSFKLLSHKDIFIQLDRFYRAHWFAKNHNLSGKESPLVNLSIIMERRKSLEWVSDTSTNWDEISLDT